MTTNKNILCYSVVKADKIRDDTVLLTYADQQISASQYLSTINLFNAFILVIVSVLIIKWYHDK
jgi:hypothetical protein